LQFATNTNQKVLNKANLPMTFPIVQYLNRN
jgi:hypothetical protein